MWIANPRGFVAGCEQRLRDVDSQHLEESLRGEGIMTEKSGGMQSEEILARGNIESVVGVEEGISKYTGGRHQSKGPDIAVQPGTILDTFFKRYFGVLRCLPPR